MMGRICERVIFSNSIFINEVIVKARGGIDRVGVANGERVGEDGLRSDISPDVDESKTVIELVLDSREL